MIAKLHKRDGKKILAICDEDILGKTFEEDNFILDLSSSFYQGGHVDIDKIRPILKVAYIINAVGKESTDFLIKEGIIEKDGIKTVMGIPHAQVLNASN